MIKVLFICHGNICRSPMAEFILRDMVKKKGYTAEIMAASAATSTEEIGNPVHYGTRKKLSQHGISTDGKTAVRLQKSDYGRYDYLIGMDQRNIANIKRIVGGDPEKKIHRLLDFTEDKRDIEDPWYTGDFDKTYDDIYKGCAYFMKKIENQL